MPDNNDSVSSLDKLFSSVIVTPRREFLTKSAAMLAATTVGGAEVAAKEHKSGAAPAVSEKDREYMAQAIKLMRQAGVVDKTGGPFGAVIVKDGVILATAGNSVLKDNDPSAHAEVNAIRAACKKVGSPHINGATLFTSCETCPMCYATSYWARIGKIFYAASWMDYKDLFDDYAIGQDMKNPLDKRSIQVAQIMRPEAVAVWEEYRALPNKERY